MSPALGSIIMAKSGHPKYTALAASAVSAAHLVYMCVPYPIVCRCHVELCISVLLSGWPRTVRLVSCVLIAGCYVAHYLPLLRLRIYIYITNKYATTGIIIWKRLRQIRNRCHLSLPTRSWKAPNEKEIRFHSWSELFCCRTLSC